MFVLYILSFYFFLQHVITHKHGFQQKYVYSKLKFIGAQKNILYIRQLSLSQDQHNIEISCFATKNEKILKDKLGNKRGESE